MAISPEAEVTALRQVTSIMPQRSKQALERALANNVNWGADRATIENEITLVISNLWPISAKAQTKLAAQMYAAIRRTQAPGGRWQGIRIEPDHPDWHEILANLQHASPDGIINWLGNGFDQALHALTGQTIAANAARDPHKPSYRVIIHGDINVCALKNSPQWQCDQVAAHVEALQPGETPATWFHPNCHCEVIPQWRNQ